MYIPNRPRSPFFYPLSAASGMFSERSRGSGPAALWPPWCNAGYGIRAVLTPERHRRQPATPASSPRISTSSRWESTWSVGSARVRDVPFPVGHASATLLQCLPCARRTSDPHPRLWAKGGGSCRRDLPRKSTRRKFVTHGGRSHPRSPSIVGVAFGAATARSCESWARESSGYQALVRGLVDGTVVACNRQTK
jgi:hypothetical protein